MFVKLKKFIHNPVSITCHLEGIFNRNRLFDRYFRLSGKVGINRVYLVLSFDCDTDEDTRVVENIHKRISAIGINPVYAVPGELLIRGQDTYKCIADSGAEFLNHGFTGHMRFNSSIKRYESCFYYNTLSRKEITDDIVKGDRAVREILGVSPMGFRIPHFGTFQKRSQLSFVHSILKELGYAYSTSTIPYFGIRYGPVFNRFGILEIPLSGTWSNPFRVLDSYGFYNAPGRKWDERDYYNEGSAIASAFSSSHSRGLLNYYADPSHIAGSKLFFETVAKWAEVSYSVSYRTLYKELNLK